MRAIFRTRCGCSQEINIPEPLDFIDLVLDRDRPVSTTISEPIPIVEYKRTFRLAGFRRPAGHPAWLENNIAMYEEQP